WCGVVCVCVCVCVFMCVCGVCVVCVWEGVRGYAGGCGGNERGGGWCCVCCCVCVCLGVCVVCVWFVCGRGCRGMQLAKQEKREWGGGVVVAMAGSAVGGCGCAVGL